MTKKNRLQWSWYVECKYDADWVEQCMMMDVDGTRQRDARGRLDEILMSFGLYQEDAQIRDQWKINGITS